MTWDTFRTLRGTKSIYLDHVGTLRHSKSYGWGGGERMTLLLQATLWKVQPEFWGLIKGHPCEGGGEFLGVHLTPSSWNIVLVSTFIVIIIVIIIFIIIFIVILIVIIIVIIVVIIIVILSDAYEKGGKQMIGFLSSSSSSSSS